MPRPVSRIEGVRRRLTVYWTASSVLQLRVVAFAPIRSSEPSDVSDRLHPPAIRGEHEVGGLDCSGHSTSTSLRLPAFDVHAFHE